MPLFSPKALATMLLLAHNMLQPTALAFRMVSMTPRSSGMIVRKASTTTGSSADSTATTTKPIPIENAYEKASMDDIVSLCKRRGFIFPSSEIYNGFAGFYDYGPLGAELKKNVKDIWWKTFVMRREDIVGLDSSIIHNPTTWKSSGE